MDTESVEQAWPESVVHDWAGHVDAVIMKISVQMASVQSQVAMKHLGTALRPFQDP